ncbi:MAG: copper chaperone PCu(A)C [Dehalococcoidia bacterium]
MTSFRGLIRIGGVALFSAMVIAGFAVAASCGGDDDDAASTPTPNAVAGKLTIDRGWVRTTTNDVAAAYFQVKNAGLDDTLLSVSAGIGSMAMIHETVTEGASSKMQEVTGGVDVPANGEVTFSPGGYHVMIMGLTSPLSEGNSVDLTLQFKNAGAVNIKVPVLAAAP